MISLSLVVLFLICLFARAGLGVTVGLDGFFYSLPFVFFSPFKSLLYSTLFYFSLFHFFLLRYHSIMHPSRDIFSSLINMSRHSFVSLCQVFLLSFRDY